MTTDRHTGTPEGGRCTGRLLTAEVAQRPARSPVRRRGHGVPDLRRATAFSNRTVAGPRPKLRRDGAPGNGFTGRPAHGASDRSRRDVRHARRALPGLPARAVGVPVVDLVTAAVLAEAPRWRGGPGARLPEPVVFRPAVRRPRAPQPPGGSGLRRSLRQACVQSRLRTSLMRASWERVVRTKLSA